MPNVDDSGRDSFGRRVGTGMAAEVFEQLKPLLIESGIDLDSGRVYTIDEINEALQSAVQRHNFMMAIATDDTRIDAFDDIRTAANYLWEEEWEAFSEHLLAITPDEEPTVAQIIGTALSLLDSWFEDETISERFGQLSLEGRWDASAEPVMTEIHSRAKEHQAFESYQEFLARWGGLDVLTFAIGLVFEGLMACADDDDRFIDIADDLLDPDAW